MPIVNGRSVINGRSRVNSRNVILDSHTILTITDDGNGFALVTVAKALDDDAPADNSYIWLAGTTNYNGLQQVTATVGNTITLYAVYTVPATGGTWAATTQHAVSKTVADNGTMLNTATWLAASVACWGKGGTTTGLTSPVQHAGGAGGATVGGGGGAGDPAGNGQPADDGDGGVQNAAGGAAGGGDGGGGGNYIAATPAGQNGIDPGGGGGAGGAGTPGTGGVARQGWTYYTLT